ncbi:MAG TPA: carbohydrate kinase family protein [Bryobacteraceae bacterium]|nr:carbohydrate kinase family protein [Bryobacteraceae bacterium]
MTPPGVLCFGNLAVDTITGPLREPPLYGRTLWVDTLEQHGGGNGATTSFTLARFGVAVRLYGFCGRDAFGDFGVDRLRAEGVDVSWIERVDLPTSATVVLVDERGARAFLHRPGASSVAFDTVPDFTVELVAGCTRFHLANPFSMPHVRRNAPKMLTRARAAGLRTSLDTGWDSRNEWMRVVGPCLPLLDLLFVNEDEAERLTGCGDAVAAARALRDGGPRDVVIKLGGRGCLLSGEHGEDRIPGFAVKAVDTTGAGDVFAGAFLAGLQRGLSWRDAAVLANAAGALSVSRVGATAGLLSFDETAEWASARATNRA